MKKYLTAVCCACFFSFQNVSLVREIPVKPADQFAVDQFGNFYFIKGNELTKADPAGKWLYSYSDPLYGEITQVDVLNALNPYLLYKDLNRLVVLDNRLNAETTVDLIAQGFLDIQFMSFSDQNNVWLYDQASDKLFRFNIRQLKITNQSLNITQLAGKENTPTTLVSTLNNVYLNVPGTGIMVFDAVGSFEKTIPFLNATSMDASGEALLLAEKNKLLLYNSSNGMTSTLLENIDPAAKVKLKADHTYLFMNGLVKDYRLPPRK